MKKKCCLLFFVCVTSLCKAWVITPDSLNRLQSLANQGLADKQYELGCLYYDRYDNVVKKDSAMGIYWFVKAAENGNLKAQIKLGFCYGLGEGVKRDDVQGHYWLTKAAEQGDTLAMKSVADDFRNGKGVEKDYSKAVDWYQKAVNNGSTGVFVQLGNCYYFGGPGLVKDYERAIYWYKKALNSIHRKQALRLIGNCYYYGGHGVEKDYSKAITWYQLAANAPNNSIDAMLQLGKCFYYGGYGIEKDYVKAVSWLSKGIEGKGSYKSEMNILGSCYYNGGFGLTKNYSEAFRWWKLAAEKGYSSSQYNLGLCYQHGYGVTKDIAQAKYWYKKAADQGDEKAKTKLESISHIFSSEEIKKNGGYDSVVELKNGSTTYFKVSKGGRYGLTDAGGKVIVSTKMEALESAGTGYLRYKLNNFWGVMNYTGNIIIDTDRGYTSIGNFVTSTKRFPYTMTGYKGECDINGRQISKIKVDPPKQNSSLSTSSSKGLTTQQNNDIYPYEYSESNSFYECQMKENKFLSLISSESFRINISQQKNGNKYLVELYLNSLVTGSTVVKWSNSSPKTTKDADYCTISMIMSNGETLRIERCMMIDKRRKDFQDSDRIGAIGIMFFPLYAYPSINNQSSNEREQYVIDQLSKYDIKSISYMGSTFSFESAKTAATFDAMVKSIRNHR